MTDTLPAGASREPQHPTLEGLKVGAYTLERLLGHGGMGSVWLGHRTDGRFEGRVAVKLMNPALLGSLGLERFRREGSMLARLAHSGIARLLDAGVASTHQPYLVLEYIDGEPIDRYAAARSLAVADRIRLVLQMLDALAHAHANLVVHRDIKPSNILVTADGQVKVLDFGIGKLLDDEPGGAASALTMDGGHAFTPDFAAPEQVRGDPITTATDVYSAGVLLYLIVAGHHPMAGLGHEAGTIPSLIDAEPPRLGLGDLDSILGKALRKAPLERYQTVIEFADDLRRYLERQPVRARPDSAAYRIRAFVRRHRAAVIVGVAAGLALVAMTVVAIIQMNIARRERNSAIQSGRLQSAMSELQGVLAADARGPDGEPLPMAGRIARAEQMLERRFQGDPYIVATVMVDLSGRFFEVGDLTAQRTMLERARVIARDANLPDPRALALCSRAINYWLEDAFDSAQADITEAKAALGPGPVADPTVESLCLEAEGKLLQSRGEGGRAVSLLERSLAVAERDPSGGRRLPAANALAEMLRLTGRTREAVPYFRRILVELDSTGYGDTDAFPNVAAFLAASLVELGEFADLDTSLRALVRDRQAGSGATRIAPRLAFLYGSGKLALGALDSADWWIARATADTSERATFARYIPATVAQLRLDQGRTVEAGAAIRNLPLRSRGQRATAAMLRARLRRLEGDSGGASRLLERELATLWGDGQPRLTLFTLPLVTAGEWRLARGDIGAADSLGQLALIAAAIDSQAVTHSALYGRAGLLRARALMAAGDLTEARRAARRAVVALGNGYGNEDSWTITAQRMVDSLSR